MKSILGIIALLTFSSEAATVAIPALETNWHETTHSSHVQTSTVLNVDLSDRTGLTVGAPILVTLSFDPYFQDWGSIWLGSFSLHDGPTRIAITGRLEMVIGAQSAFSEVTDVLVDANLTNSECGPMCAFTDVAGYSLGAQMGVLTLTVPWSADLSTVQVRLSQDATHTNGGFTTSNYYLGAGQAGSSNLIQLSLASVPEPTAAGLLLSCAFLALRRGRDPS